MDLVPAWFGMAVIVMIGLTVLACPICTAIVAGTKGRDAGGWFLLGLLFGPFGLLAAVGVTSLAVSSVEIIDYAD